MWKEAIYAGGGLDRCGIDRCHDPVDNFASYLTFLALICLGYDCEAVKFCRLEGKDERSLLAWEAMSRKERG